MSEPVGLPAILEELTRRNAPAAPRVCEVCGARVRNFNPRTTTCDPICTRARDNGFTREQQIKRDIADEAREERLGYMPDPIELNRCHWL